MASRMKNSIRNSLFGLFAEATTLILGFVVRSVFVATLSEDYLGVNGLFTNILQVLSFAELGIGNAIVFSLYKPIREGDELKISQYVSFYKTAYRLIGTIVALFGLALVPFLNVIIRDKPNIPENLTMLYLLYLANTALSYFMVWKRTFMTANQQRYIGTVVEQIFTVIQVALQIIFLYKTHNFVVYLLIMIISNQLRNLVISIICSKKYPIVNKKPEKGLDKDEKKSIFENIKALLVYKLASVALGSSDNIILQAVINFRSVSLYSNYSMIMLAFRSLTNQLLNGVTASVGNLNAGDDNESKEKIFYRLLFISFWLYAMLSVGFIVTVNSLISVWLGKKFVIGMGAVCAIMFSFYVEGMQFPGFTYRTTMGLFKESQAAPVAATILNIILSIFMGKIFGMAGIFAATGISRILTTTWVDAYLVFTKKLKKSPLPFYKKYVLYFIFTAFATLLTKLAIDMVTITGWIGVILKIAVCFVLFNVLFLAAFGRTRIFKEVVEMISPNLKGRKKNG